MQLKSIGSDLPSLKKKKKNTIKLVDFSRTAVTSAVGTIEDFQVLPCHINFGLKVEDIEGIENPYGKTLA